jgi:hypothetical protein
MQCEHINSNLDRINDFITNVRIHEAKLDERIHQLEKSK